MSAWTTLIERSGLAIGSAWAHLTHQFAGCGGLSNVTTVAVTVSTQTATASVHDSAIASSVHDAALAGVLHDTRAKATPALGITVIVDET